MWQENNGYNICENLCPEGYKWNGHECKSEADFINFCQSTSIYAYEKSQSQHYITSYIGNCDHTCHQLEIVTATTGGNEDSFAPVQISCIGDNGFKETRGSTPDTEVISRTVGGEGACIYRVERQTDSKGISAIRYFWHANGAYHVDTHGTYLHGAATTEIFSFKGCIQGLWERIAAGSKNEVDIGYTYSYPVPFQCATDDWSSVDRGCKCNGIIYYGPLYGHDEGRGPLNFL